LLSSLSKIVHIYYSEIILPGGVNTHLLADREISVNSSSSIQKCVSIVGYATIHNLKLNDSVLNQNHTRQVMGCQLKLVTSNPANQLDAQDLDLWRTKILNKYLTVETLCSHLQNLRIPLPTSNVTLVLRQASKSISKYRGRGVEKIVGH